MFLSKLDLEKKNLFLDLSIYASLSDNDFTEKSIVDQYANEMGLEQGKYNPTKDLNIVLKELGEKCSREEINIITIEIIALIMSDSLYNTMEKNFVIKLQEAFDISEKKLDEIFIAVDHLKVSYNMLEKVIEK